MATFAAILRVSTPEFEAGPLAVVEGLGMGVAKGNRRVASIAVLAFYQVKPTRMGIPVAILAARGSSAEGPRLAPCGLSMALGARQIGVRSIQIKPRTGVHLRIKFVGSKSQVGVALQAIRSTLRPFHELPIVGIVVTALTALRRAAREAFVKSGAFWPVTFG
ncbi:MAG: hypothetical protein P1V35_08280, partial [Planctomycetota bacterium]|nr:hypothetical protein [Planctomycetota bacterium]